VRLAFWDGDPTGGRLIGTDTINPNPADPLGQGEVSAAQATWAADQPGTHEIYVQVDPNNTIGEIDENNNQSVQTIWLPASRVYLPLISRQNSRSSGAAAATDSEPHFMINLPTPTPIP
jgi:hypothetical protein